jgi:hypothetical protein
MRSPRRAGDLKRVAKFWGERRFTASHEVHQQTSPALSLLSDVDNQIVIRRLGGKGMCGKKYMGAERSTL